VIDARSTHRNALENEEEVLVEDPPAAGGGQAGSVEELPGHHQPERVLLGSGQHGHHD